jgi:hypothetical protein
VVVVILFVEVVVVVAVVVVVVLRTLKMTGKFVVLLYKTDPNPCQVTGSLLALLRSSRQIQVYFNLNSFEEFPLKAAAQAVFQI